MVHETIGNNSEILGKEDIQKRRAKNQLLQYIDNHKFLERFLYFLSIFDILKREKTITSQGEAMYEREIETKVRKLPEDLKKEVLDYIEFLLEKYRGRKIKKRKFKFDWEGGLSDIRDEFTSVELQHKASEWR